jgi:hypothetical protein
MVVQVISSSLMASDLTRHQARSVGDGWWEASWLRGRKLTVEQAAAAMVVADQAPAMVNSVYSAVGAYVRQLGLTPFEAIGMAVAVECQWPAVFPAACPVESGAARLADAFRSTFPSQPARRRWTA